MPKNRVTLVIVAVLLVAAAASAVYATQQGRWGGAAVAVVNGEPITERDLYQAMLESGGDQVLQRLIEQRLVEQAARARSVTATREEVEAKLKGLKDRYGEEVFASLLAQQGLSEDALRQLLRFQVLVEKLVAPDVKLTDEDVRKYYEDHKAEFVEAEQVHARHILVEDEETARSLVARLRSGESFADLAKAHSIDAASAQSGGDLGWFERGAMVPEFEQAAFAAQPRTIVGPVRSQFGFHVIEVLERKPERQKTFDEVAQELRERLHQERLQERAQAYLEELRQKARIEERLGR